MNETKQEQLIEKLLFAAGREQTRARRWRIFFMLFFIAYLIFITGYLINSSNVDYQVGGEADGEMHTALVKVDGIIASGEKGGAKTVMRGLRDAFDHDDTAQVVVEINSPGGSPVEASRIFDEIKRLRAENEDVPLYAVVNDVAASGGYYIAAAADKIYVNRSSLVGSIGVRMDAFGFVDLIENIGVERRLLTAGADKGLYDPFLPEQQSHREHLQTMLGDVHQHFIDSVKTGRGDRLNGGDELFNGLIWSGERALDLGLADEFGSTDSVARDAGAEDIKDFTPGRNLIDRISERIGASLAIALRSSLSDFRLQ